MEATFELDVAKGTRDVVWTDEDGNDQTTSYPTRSPDFAGADIPRWAQREDRGDTMLIWVDADQAQIDLLPAERRRG